MVSARYLSTSFFLHLLVLLSFLVVFRLSEVRSAKYIEIDLDAYLGPELRGETQKEGKKEVGSLLNQPFFNQPLPAKEQRSEQTLVKGDTNPTMVNQEEFSAKKEASSQRVLAKETPLPAEGSGGHKAAYSVEAANEGGLKAGGSKGKAQEGKEAEKAGEQFLAQKFSIISDIVRRHLQYPYLARRMGWEGKVVVSFVLTKEGTVKEVKVVNSSGYKVLDENTVATLQACAKYFPIPPVDVKIKLPVTYKLN